MAEQKDWSDTSPQSQSTQVTTPDQSPGEDDDIWASDSDHGYSEINNNNRGGDEMQSPTQNTATKTTSSRQPHQSLLSDLPQVRRQHMTDGYREGLAIGKARVMQQGFDEGYPIGVRIALRAGKVLGTLEGYLAASKRMSTTSSISKSSAFGSGTGSAADQGVGVDTNHDNNKNSHDDESMMTRRIEGLNRLYQQAKDELACTALLEGVDDQVIHDAGYTTSPSDTDGPTTTVSAAATTTTSSDKNTLSTTASAGIPDKMETIVQKWEGLVLSD